LFNSVLILLPVLLVYAVTCKLRGHGIVYERVKITELREGAIPAEAIYVELGKVKRQRGIGSLKGKKLLANPRMAAGLTRYQVGVLKRLVKERKLQNQILTKKGMPFGPALAAGTWVGVFFGDIYWFLLSYLL
jgi:prepilin signal peptidase PulO-like enzyme (type II secretory pathway)